MSLYAVSDKTLASIAEAIRSKSGKTERLNFPKEFISEINNLELSNQYDYFEGNYLIIPSVDSQTLETEGKLMKNNVNIREIPYYEVSNEASGKTVYIGGDLNA